MWALVVVRMVGGSLTVEVGRDGEGGKGGKTALHSGGENDLCGGGETSMAEGVERQI